MKIHMKTEVGPFEGSPTAGGVAAALVFLPDDAFVSLEVWDSQRDGAGWRVKAHWSEDRGE